MKQTITISFNEKAKKKSSGLRGFVVYMLILLVYWGTWCVSVNYGNWSVIPYFCNLPLIIYLALIATDKVYQEEK
jgi:uncharacterized membrane protein